MPRLLKAVLAVLLPLAAGGYSGYLTAGAINDWFLTLNKPSFNPPSWVFGPVWTLLYLLMGWSLYRIWRLPASTQRSTAMGVFFIQLILNFFWSLIFFRWQAMGFALLEIALLWISIAAMIHLFRKLDSTAGYINIPYLLWVSFATALNTAYWVLN
jgi:tryptophan-rich sensory protein